MRRPLAAACALAALACARAAPAPAEPRAPAGAESGADTLRGTVRVVGSEPGTVVVLRPASGVPVTLVGERRVLERLAGLEVRVDGVRRPGGRFHVERVTVRAAAGVPAVDGVLAREGERWLLLTADGRRLPVARLPPALRGRAGARVWLAGPPGEAPAAFGVIADSAGTQAPLPPDRAQCPGYPAYTWNQTCPGTCDWGGGCESGQPNCPL